MPMLESLTISDIREVLKNKSLQRARTLLGQVHNPRRAGNTLTADVFGTRRYRVQVDVTPAGILAQCDCPYDWGGYCKHVGALLLKWIHQRSVFQEDPEVKHENVQDLEVIQIEHEPTFVPDYVPFWRETLFEERREREKRELGEWLIRFKLADLREIARLQNWKARGNRKDVLVQQLLERYAEPGHLKEVYHSLDQDHQRVLRVMVLLGISRTISDQERRRVAECWGEAFDDGQFESIQRNLTEMGLALSGSMFESYPHITDFVPDYFARYFPPLLEGVVASQMSPQACESSRQIKLADPIAFVRTVHQIMVWLEKSPIRMRRPMARPRIEVYYRELEEWGYYAKELYRLQRTGNLASNRDLTLGVPPLGLTLPDESIEWMAPVAGGVERLEFIISLLRAASIVQPGSPITVWRENKLDYLQRSESAQRAILGRVYVQMVNWSALWPILRSDPGLRLRRRFNIYQWESFLLDLLRFRHLVLRVLAALPENEWILLDKVLQISRALWPNFVQGEWDTYQYGMRRPEWFLSKSESGKPLSLAEIDDWDRAQGAFIRQIITGPLHWLGFTDLCHDSNQLVAIRMQGLADLYWNRKAVPPIKERGAARKTDEREGAISISGEFITLHPGEVSGCVHSMLDGIARLETVEIDRFVYRLDPMAVYESFENGETLEQILDGWEEIIKQPITETILSRLSALWESYGRVRIYRNLTLIEFADESALAEMKAVTSLERHLISELSNRLVVIPAQVVDELWEELERAKYTPTMKKRAECDG